MATDARISTGLPSHPKTKKLVRRLGPGAGWGLVCLFLWAASNRSDGDLSGMSTEDIELAADWDGDDGAFVKELCAVRFLDGEEGCYVIHDWSEHNPWAAGAESRSLKAKWNAAKRHHGAAEADKLFPEYAAIRNASSTDAAEPQQADIEQVQKRSNAPSPSPSPSPSPLPTPSHSEPKGSGGKPPTNEEIIFSYGLSLLTSAGSTDKAARSFLGGLRKGRDDTEVVNALRDCIRAKPLQPLEWLAAALPPAGTRSKPNAQEALEAQNREVGRRFLEKESMNAPQ